MAEPESRQATGGHPDPLVAPHVARMVPYKPGKPVAELERELGIRNAIKLASNENPLGPSPHVAALLGEAGLRPEIYPDGSGFELRQALAAHHDVAMNQVVLGNGSNELIDLVCRTFAYGDDHLVFGKPSFVCYWLGSVASNLAYTEAPLKDDLAWDVDALLSAVTPKTKIVFVANPNNPTGAHMTRADLARLVHELPPRVVLVLDEAYVEFADADDFASAFEFRAERERLLVLRTFSKAYGLAALRVGYVVGAPELIDYLNRMRAPFNVNALAQRAALAALGDPEHVAKYVALNRVERARVGERLEALGLTVAPSQANFLLVDVRPRGFTGAQVYDALLSKGVIVRPMPPPLEGFVRITIGLETWNDRLLEVATEVCGG